MVHLKRRIIALAVVAAWLLAGVWAFGRIDNTVIWLGLGLLAGVVLLDVHIRQTIRDTTRPPAHS